MNYKNAGSQRRPVSVSMSKWPKNIHFWVTMGRQFCQKIMEVVINLFTPLILQEKISNFFS